MMLTVSILEAIRDEFSLEVGRLIDPNLDQIMAAYDRATALALGKRFLKEGGGSPGPARQIKGDLVVMRDENQ